MRMTQAILLLTMLLPELLAAQARIRFDNDAFLVLDNGAFLVIDNPNANALATNAGAGNLVSEDEDDLVRWNIGTATGTYTLPWTTANGVKVPLVHQITAAGTGAGHYLYSTHTDNNAVDNWNNLDYRPSDVTNMGGAGIPNNSPSAIDRFWRIQPLVYTAAPPAIFSFGYDDAERTAVGNNIPIGTLFAQRFDTGQNKWEEPGYGADNFPILNVSGAVIPSGTFRSWTLVTSLLPLPTEGVVFAAMLEGKDVKTSWEIDHPEDFQAYRIEHSRDGLAFTTLVEQAATPSNQAAWIHAQPGPGLHYYRLQSLDQNGGQSYSQIEAIAISGRTTALLPHPLAVGETATLWLQGWEGASVHIQVVDLMGKVLWEEQMAVDNGELRQELPGLSGFAAGTYFLEVRDGAGMREVLRVLVR